MEGYTPQFRALNTAEGDFHAEFTTTNQKTRGYVRTLSQAHPNAEVVASFVSKFNDDRKSLWSLWKRSLPDHLKPIVVSVREAHHGTGLLESGSADFRSFLSLVQETGRRNRLRLDDLVAAMPKDTAVEDCRVGICASLDSLSVAQERLDANF